MAYELIQIPKKLFQTVDLLWERQEDCSVCGLAAFEEVSTGAPTEELLAPATFFDYLH